MRRLNQKFCVVIVLAIMLISLIIPAPLASAKGESLTILFTHDMHDHLLPYTQLKDGNIITLGGYARLYTAITEERKKDSNLLLVDAGDFSMGTLFQTIFDSHAPQLRIMGQMGYDVTTFGNHEFDFRADGLAHSLSVAKDSGDPLPKIVATNVSFPMGQEAELTPSLEKLKNSMDGYGVEDYIVLERKGIRIGVFGLMGKDAISNAPMAEVQFEDPIEKAKETVDILKNREKVDLILCLSHSGTDGDSPKTEDEILAKEVPEIDIIISGHSHTELKEPIIVGSTIIGSCGEYGQNLGVIRISRNQNNLWVLDDYNLEPIDDSIPQDEEIINTIAYYKDIVKEDYLDEFSLSFDEILARSPFNFTPSSQIGDEHKEEPLGNLISDAYIYAVQQAEGEDYEPIAVSIVPKGTIRGSFVKGDISVSDVFIVSSLGIGGDGTPGYPLVSVYLTGKELKTVCEVDSSITPIMKAAQLYMSGISYTFNPNRLIFNRATNISFQHPDGSLEEIDDNKLYRIVAGLYSAQMLPTINDKSFGLLSLIPKTKEGDPVINYEDHIIMDRSKENGGEVKEWYAIAQYLESFDKGEDGLPIIPLYYSKAQNRKILDNSKDFASLLKEPNKIAILVYLILLVLISGLGFLIIKIIKRRMKKVKLELNHRINVNINTKHKKDVYLL